MFGRCRQKPSVVGPQRTTMLCAADNYRSRTPDDEPDRLVRTPSERDSPQTLSIARNEPSPSIANAGAGHLTREGWLPSTCNHASPICLDSDDLLTRSETSTANAAFFDCPLRIGSRMSPFTISHPVIRFAQSSFTRHDTDARPGMIFALEDASAVGWFRTVCTVFRRSLGSMMWADDGWQRSLVVREVRQHGFYARPPAHRCRLFKPPSGGRIFRSSGIECFVQGGVVKTFRCPHRAYEWYSLVAMRRLRGVAFRSARSLRNVRSQVMTKTP